MTALHRRARRRSDAGFTLIEVMAAIVVFALVALAGTSMILNSISISKDTRNRTQAASVAAQKLEVVRNASTQSCWVEPVAAGCALTLSDTGNTTTTQAVAGQTFTVVQALSWLAKAAPTGSCDAPTQGGNSAVQPVLLVQESVTWPAMGGRKPVTAATEIAPPVGQFTGNTGGISVKILDHAAAPVVDIPVTVTQGGSTTNLVSNADGCTFAAYLAPGTYAVTLAKSGYVDNQNLATSTQQVTVTSGAISTATFYFDRAAQINVGYATGSLPAATNLPATVYNSGLSGLGTVSFPPNITSLTPLYPYPAYGIWAGHCPEADPSAVDASNNPLYPGASETQVPTIAGGTTTASVPLYPLSVQVVGVGGVPVSGAVVTLTETAGSAKTACTAPFNTYGLANSGASGTSATAVPLGHFTVTATFGARTGTANVFVTPSGTTATVTMSVRGAGVGTGVGTGVGA